MNRLYILIVFVLVLGDLNCQSREFKIQLAAKDSINVKVLNIYPDSFPNVSVVFRAYYKNGNPIWNLNKKDLTIQENSKIQFIEKLFPISQNKPINIGLVVDHSGSMQDDFSKLYDSESNPLYSFDDSFNIILPEGYTHPIDDAKNAVKGFVESFNNSKDYISLIGFSDTIYENIELTQSIDSIKLVIDSMNANYNTALYDAMFIGLSHLDTCQELNALVTLTDGRDNCSKIKWEQVVNKANLFNVPLFIIGLGDVDKDTLEYMTIQTNGQLYITQNSNSLDSIYHRISRTIQSFYDLKYKSENLASVDSIKEIVLTCVLDSGVIATDNKVINLPTEVVAYLKEKETKRTTLLYGIIFITILVAAGTIIMRKKNK